MRIKVQRKETYPGVVRFSGGFRLYRFGWMLGMSWGKRT